MNGVTARFVRFGAGLLALVMLGWILTGQAAKLEKPFNPARHGVPTDWSHHNVIFSEPRTDRAATEALNDPRYWQQWYRRHVVRVLSTETDIASEEMSTESRKGHKQGLWAESMGAGANVGATNYPAKYSFNINVANCGTATQPDFVVFGTGLQSSATKASLVAFDNLYSGCSGTVPSVYFAYNTTATAPGTIKTSPVFSLDGKQLAFVQTDGLHGTVILLKWAANTGAIGAPAAPALKGAGAYVGCTAPCMTNLDLRTPANVQTNDTTSSIFYDYGGDVAWVGDSLGFLHKFHPFFNGTPTEIRTSPWPVQVNTANPWALTSPVYDHNSLNVFVADAGGYFERVSAASGTSTVSAQLDHGTGVISTPILDQAGGVVYVFASNDGGTGCAGGPCSAVFLFGTGFAGATSGAETTVGASSGTPNPLYNGDFDSAYQNSRSATGNLYVCGNTGANPTLYQIPITAGVAPAAGTALFTITGNGSTTSCSPVTDLPNPNLNGGSEERVFFSSHNNGRPTICGGKGCLVSFVDTPWQANTAYAVGQEIFSPLLHTEVAITTGTSGATAPAWTATNGATVADGGVTWLDQGAPTAVPVTAWAASHVYAVGARILDTNGAIEIATVGGRSGATQPTWPTTPGLTTTDNKATWIESGSLPTAAYQSNGGTSGIIMDNVVGPGTLAGASQVYFSTLTNQACVTSGTTGGCAVQASQSALQ